MSNTFKQKPAHNYARIVQGLPPCRNEVNDTLSNEHGRLGRQDSIDSSQYKTYLITHNHAYYQGPWSKGLPQGKGTCIFSDGSYYQGNFQEGEADDQKGYLILSNGATYRGSIKRSIIQGSGQMRHNLGKEPQKPLTAYVYKGSWRAGKPDGFGIQQYGDGSKYQGYFLEGVKNCFNQKKTIKQKVQQFRQKGKLQKQSQYQSAAGEIYKGQFLNGRMHGFGDFRRAIGNLRFTGQFRNGKKQGQGSLHTSTGILSGNFDNDMINGLGKFEWNKEDGRIYIGHFKNSKFDGEGRIQLKNGNILEGVWKDGHSLELKAVNSNKH